MRVDAICESAVVSLWASNAFEKIGGGEEHGGDVNELRRLR